MICTQCNNEVFEKGELCDDCWNQSNIQYYEDLQADEDAMNEYLTVQFYAN